MTTPPIGGGGGIPPTTPPSGAPPAAASTPATTDTLKPVFNLERPSYMHNILTASSSEIDFMKAIKDATHTEALTVVDFILSRLNAYGGVQLKWNQGIQDTIIAAKNITSTNLDVLVNNIAVVTDFNTFATSQVFPKLDAYNDARDDVSGDWPEPAPSDYKDVFSSALDKYGDDAADASDIAQSPDFSKTSGVSDYNNTVNEYNTNVENYKNLVTAQNSNIASINQQIALMNAAPDAPNPPLQTIPTIPLDEFKDAKILPDLDADSIYGAAILDFSQFQGGLSRFNKLILSQSSQLTNSIEDKNNLVKRLLFFAPPGSILSSIAKDHITSSTSTKTHLPSEEISLISGIILGNLLKSISIGISSDVFTEVNKLSLALTSNIGKLSFFDSLSTLFDSANGQELTKESSQIAQVIAALKKAFELINLGVTATLAKQFAESLPEFKTLDKETQVTFVKKLSAYLDFQLIQFTSSQLRSFVDTADLRRAFTPRPGASRRLPPRQDFQASLQEAIRQTLPANTPNQLIERFTDDITDLVIPRRTEVPLRQDSADTTTKSPPPAVTTETPIPRETQVQATVPRDVPIPSTGAQVPVDAKPPPPLAPSQEGVDPLSKRTEDVPSGTPIPSATVDEVKAQEASLDPNKQVRAPAAPATLIDILRESFNTVFPDSPEQLKESSERSESIQAVFSEMTKPEVYLPLLTDPGFLISVYNIFTQTSGKSLDKEANSMGI
jgi:hypothetical protein